MSIKSTDPQNAEAVPSFAEAVAPERAEAGERRVTESPSFDESVAGEEDPGASLDDASPPLSRPADPLPESPAAAPPSKDAAPVPDGGGFRYRGYRFTCAAVRTPQGLYQGRVGMSVPGTRQMRDLEPDSAPYSTEGEAMRHAREQAVRWIHDATGTPTGQF